MADADERYPEGYRGRLRAVFHYWGEVFGSACQDGEIASGPR